MSGIAYPLTILFATHLLHLEVESADESDDEHEAIEPPAAFIYLRQAYRENHSKEDAHQF